MGFKLVGETCLCLMMYVFKTVAWVIIDQACFMGVLSRFSWVFTPAAWVFKHVTVFEPVSWGSNLFLGFSNLKHCYPNRVS